MEASGGNQVSLTISSFVGDMFGTECRDYITVTDGPTSDNTLLDKNCTTLSNVVINSTARWMMVQFKADGATFTSGFMATVSAVKAATDISTYDTTIQDCNSHMYLCSNKICVVRAYICDGFNDCGCTNECDESSCDGIGLSAADNIGLGVGIGGFIFIVIFLVVHFIERHRKKKALMQEEETDRQIRNSKKKGGGKEKDTKDKKDAKGHRFFALGMDTRSYDAAKRNYDAKKRSYGATKRSYDAKKRSYYATKRSYDAKKLSYGATKRSYDAKKRSYDAKMEATSLLRIVTSPLRVTVCLREDAMFPTEHRM
ncbi:hypothetical protein FSP39_024239 [Pinctada imbricata]|uniref:CUB domain-containing protein n=1 Tax=Pinctada imbricata TaxID=66713 RepID=A0AA88Y616_PINIB|nr:hypothetical protein FSP39_024239 [Pinctada imbricata]